MISFRLFDIILIIYTFFLKMFFNNIFKRSICNASNSENCTEWKKDLYLQIKTIQLSD